MGANAQTNTTDAPVRVIPQPRELTLTAAAADFRLTRDTRLVLADARSTDDRFAAQDFAEDVRATAHIALKFGNRRERNAIIIGTLEQPSMQAALKRVNVAAPANLNEEGYVLNVSEREIVVAGRTAAGVF